MVLDRAARDLPEEHRRAARRVVEAYPVDPDSPSYRFMGFVGTFDAMGFERAGRAGTRRYVVRRRVE